jgi:DNA-binding MarR family transcriptional regulator
MSRSKTSQERLMKSIYEIGRIMRQRMEAFGKGKTNFLQIHALLIVSERPGITMKELALSLHVTSPSATSLVNRLVKTSLVSRHHDRKNRKLVRLRITGGGLALLKAAHRERAKAIGELFSLLSPAELRTLVGLHEKVLRAHATLHASSPSRS